jgi:uncharacterized protein YqjF (DUF2071 family)
MATGSLAVNSTLAMPQVRLVRPVFLSTRWHALAMLNWRIDPAVLEPFVPRGTELDFQDRETFVSIVGFVYRDTRLLGLSIPWHVNFEEVNLRFYVRRCVGEEVRRAVCFIKEIVPKVAIAATARWCYNERFVTLPMRHEITGPALELLGPNQASGRRQPPGNVHFDGEQSSNGTVAYCWRFNGRWHSLSLDYAGRPAPLAPGSHEEFIAEHYWGYCRQRDGGTLEYRVEHPSWHIWPASNVQFDCDAARLYAPQFADVLCTPPTSAFLADGSAVSVLKPVRIA